MIDLGKSVVICAMSKTGQMTEEDIEAFDTVIGINNTHDRRHLPKLTMIVAMDDLKRDEKPEPEYVDSIVNAGVPVYSTRKFKKWPAVTPYPIKDVVAWLDDMAPVPAYKLLDNSICYSTALALSKGVKKIGFSGVDLTQKDREVDLECAPIRWKHRGYGHAPWWFMYYDEQIFVSRRPLEVGWESLHFLIGLGTGLGVKFVWEKDSTILNTDRKPYFYGFEQDPL